MHQIILKKILKDEKKNPAYLKLKGLVNPKIAEVPGVTKD
jgi:hypothetical protein